MDHLFEGQLLLYVFQVALRMESAAWFRLMTAADWAAVVRQADHHELGPLLFALFAEPGVVRPPAEVLEQLETRYRRTEADNERKFDQLARVCVALRDEQVPVIVLKGAALAETVYERRALRSMSDLDVLVRREDLTRAEGVLWQLGYESRADYFGADEAFREHCHHLVPFEHRASEVAVEVHWNLVTAATGTVIDPDRLWERARPATLAGTDALVLAPEDFLLHLCLHATVSHRLEVKLRDLYDVALLLRRHGGGIDFAEFLGRATGHGLRRCVYVYLELARQLLGAPLDRAWLHELRGDPLDDCLVGVFRDRLLGAAGTNPFQALWGRRAPGPGRYWKDYCDIALGCEPLWGVEESGFHEQEVDEGRPVRWTDGATRLVVPVDEARPPRALKVRLWIGTGGTTLRICADGHDLFHGRVPAGAWSETLALPVTGSPSLLIELYSDVYVPRAHDGSDVDRALGVLVEEVRLLDADPAEPA